VTYEVSTVRARRVVDFIEQFLVVPEGKDVGKPVRLRDWQLEFIDKVYSTPTRRAILSTGRKNGKSAITAMLLLAHLAGPEALPNSQIYSAAQSRDQASLVFGLAAPCCMDRTRWRRGATPSTIPGSPCAVQGQRRSPSSHPQAAAPGDELARV
jgi:phage terminase large subunit-like protein